MKTGAEKLAERYPLAEQMVEEGTASPQLRRAVELLLEGKYLREIGEEMGISTSRAQDLLKDPTGVEADSRRRRNHGLCIDCGRKTYNGGSIDTPDRCATCAPKHVRAETRKRVISAIRDWAERYGSPPSAQDWNIALAQRSHPARLTVIEQAHRDREWPGASTAQAAFGSWNAAIEAAGFEPLQPSERRDPEAHKRHLKGRRNVLKPAEVIDREIEKNEQRKKTLTEQVAQIDQNVEQLKQAKAVLGKAA